MDKTYLSADILKLIVRKIVNLGGDTETSFLPRGAYFSVSKEICVHHSTVKIILRRFCVTKSYDPAPHTGGKKTDIRFIQYLVQESPSI